jgi:hypothetical protein
MEDLEYSTTTEDELYRQVRFITEADPETRTFRIYTPDSGRDRGITLDAFDAVGLVRTVMDQFMSWYDIRPGNR